MISLIQCKRFKSLILVSLIACFILGCGEKQATDEQWVKRAKTELKPFKQKLMSLYLTAFWGFSSSMYHQKVSQGHN